MVESWQQCPGKYLLAGPLTAYVERRFDVEQVAAHERQGMTA